MEFLLNILFPALLIGGLGLIFGLGLAFASKKFEVKVDERIAQVREVLPGANCGACGFTGCDGYAEGIVEGKCDINGCPVGGVELVTKLSGIMGVDASTAAPKTARVMCGGTTHYTTQKYQYDGIKECSAATSLHNGAKSCSYACLGFGDCVKVCAFGAIEIIDGVAKINEKKCTACGKCITSCPKSIISLVNKDSKYSVVCSNYYKGAVTRKNCQVGCIACGKCVRVCESKAVTVSKNKAKIDDELCINCGECEKVCPTRAIREFKCHI